MAMMVFAATLSISNADPATNFSVAATGFAWAENMVCVAARAALFVTENKRGELWRITWDGSRYNQTLLVSASVDFRLLAGLAADADGHLFALGNRHNNAFAEDGGKCVLVEVNTSEACATSCAAPYRIVSTLSRPCLGDGLTVDATHFYSANEGDFVPLRGRVVRIGRSGSATAEVLVDHGFADDGVALDAQRGLLYVSEVWSPTHTVLVYNVSAGAMARELHPSGVSSLDDFTLSTDGEELYGADFLGGRVVALPLLGESPSPQARTLLSGVTSPTSVRRGCMPQGGGLSEDTLFVSEGGGLSPSETNRRVLAFRAPPSRLKYR